MNLGEMRSLMRSFLTEDTPGFWTNAELNNYINLAAKRVNSIISATREDFFTQSATFVTVANQKSYSFPSDARFLRRMEIYDTSDSGYIIKLDELKWPRIEAGGDWLFPTTAQPKRYVIVGTHFDLLPIPDAVYPIRLWYDYSQVDLSSDSDTPTTPVDYHDMIVYWALVLAKKQNDEDDQGYAAIFNLRKSELIEFLRSRGGDDPKAVESYLEGII